MSTRGASAWVRKTPDRLAGLDEQRLVVPELAQRAHDRVEALPVARGLADPAVDDEVLGALGHLGVEVVHEHAQGGLLLPRPAGERGAARGADGAGGGRGRHISHLGLSPSSSPRVVVSVAVRPCRPGRRGSGCGRLAALRAAHRPALPEPLEPAERAGGSRRRGPRRAGQPRSPKRAGDRGHERRRPGPGGRRRRATARAGVGDRRLTSSTPAYRRPPRPRPGPRLCPEQPGQASISGARTRSCPWAATRSRTSACTASSAGEERSGRRNSRAWQAASSSTARMRARVADHRARPCGRRSAPMETWSSLPAEVGMESTLAGWARTLFSEARAAAVTWAIMRPECSPPSRARKAGRPESVGLTRRSMRRSLIAPELGGGDRQQVGGDRHRLAVEVAAGEDLAGLGEDHGVVGGGVHLDGDGARRRRRGRRGRRRGPAACSAGCRRPGPCRSPRCDSRSALPASSRRRLRAEAAWPGCGRAAWMRGSKATSVPCSASRVSAPITSAERARRRASASARPPTAVMSWVPLMRARPSLGSRTSGAQAGGAQRLGAGQRAARRGRTRPRRRGRGRGGRAGRGRRWRRPSPARGPPGGCRRFSSSTQAARASRAGRRE